VELPEACGCYEVMGGDAGLDSAVGGLVDQRLMGEVGGPGPAVRVVPAHPGNVAGGDVVDVEEYFVAALASPHLVVGVAGIAQDGPDRGLSPGVSGSMWVADAVVAGGRRDPLGGEPLGDGVVAVSGEEQLEDVGHDLGGGRVGLQPVQAGADGGLGGVGVGAGVDQPIAVGWSATQEAVSSASRLAPTSCSMR
jgi:hypothetical protein